MRLSQCAVAALFVAAAPVLATPAEYGRAMLELATKSGCMACHTLVPTAPRGDGLAPIAPAWRDVAIKYRDDPGASERLTRTVMTGSNPQARHWAGKIGEVAMPPNAAVVSEADARALVNWILVLVP